MRARFIEVAVGLFMLGAIIAFLILAFRVSGLMIEQRSRGTYQVTAEFDNIGNLKVRAPVTVAGVRIGQIQAIHLDPQSFKAVVTLAIQHQENHLPADSQASIVTAGLLGANYIELNPGFEEHSLQEGSRITDTQSALQLETMVGQLLFNINKQDKKSEA